MTEFKSLFSPGRIGRFETKNRLVMAPMVRNYADETGKVTPRYLAHLTRIARGGVGTMILEASFISPEARGFTHQLGIHSDDMIEGLQSLVATLHEHNVLVGPQLYHAGRQTRSQITGHQPVAPSPIADPLMQEEPRELSIEEIRDVIGNYGKAALRAKQAGFDFVEIHGAHGYLITQFLSPAINKRDDEYGGSFDNRVRFLEEVVSAVKGAVGQDLAVIVRLSGDDMLEGGITIDDTVNICQRLEKLDVDAVHISAGTYASYTKGYMIQPMSIEDGPLVPYAEKVKQNVSIPVITVGKLRWPSLANEVIESGKADFVAIARTLLADPDWPVKAQEGRTKEIDYCIACNQGCISRLFEQKDVWCTVNPECSREQEFAEPLLAKKMKVLVIGGGPAGMEAAITAKQRGDNVILVERLDHLGGQLIAAAAAPYRPGWREFREYLTNEVQRLDIDVRLNTEATEEMVREINPDLAIIATGSHAVSPKIPGIEHSNAVTSRDILEGKSEAKGDVLVAGGGCSGAQTAEYLAEKGHKVTIVEMMDSIATDSPLADQSLLLERLRNRGVKMMTKTKIIEMQDSHVIVDTPEGKKDLQADTVVLCLGSAPNDSLQKDLQKVVQKVITVGDAVEARKVTEATVEGAEAALTHEHR